MGTARLTIDLGALCANWKALDAQTACETAAVVKADAYGLGMAQVAPALAEAGARTFFVAASEEGAALRDILGPGPEICVFSGHMPGDADLIGGAQLVPMINSIDQMLLYVESLPGHPFGVQLDSGMNRLGMEPAEWRALRDIALQQNPRLIMSHLACADEPEHAMNATQLRNFQDMTQGLSARRSLSATGGLLLGEAYHFDMCRPGIGLYGGLPFADALAVVQLDVPVIQIRDVLEGESVGYGNTWIAPHATRVATIAAGYADGLHRSIGAEGYAWVGGTKCKILGRVSMDMIAVDVTHLPDAPETVTLISKDQTVDTLAEWAGTIGYEVLTSLGARYQRDYTPA